MRWTSMIEGLFLVFWIFGIAYALSQAPGDQDQALLTDQQMVEKIIAHEFDVHMFGEARGWGIEKHYRDNQVIREETQITWLLAGRSLREYTSSKSVIDETRIEVRTTYGSELKHITEVDLSDPSIKVLAFCQERRCLAPRHFYARLMGEWHRL